MQLSRATRRFSLEGIAMKSPIFGFALLSVIAVVASAPAQAQNGSLTRSFVSSAGVDSNPCTITQPCATFAQAYTKVGANGIVAALDPGKYGPLTISGPVTVNGNGWAAITAPAQGNGITISAGSGKVILTGLEIDGAGAAYSGIVLTSGGGLIIENCTLQNFVNGGAEEDNGNAIAIEPTGSNHLDFAITNTIISDAVIGLLYAPSGGSTATSKGIIDHVTATGNLDDGIMINTSLGGGAAGVAISNSSASNNGIEGILVINSSESAVTVSIDNVSVAGNAVRGIEVDNTAMVLLGRSVITTNGTGIVNDTGPNNTFYTFGDNRIGGNTTDITGNTYTSLSTSFAPQ